MTNKSKLYIAGPMSGLPQFNFPAFLAAAEGLRAQGFDIVSPAELDDEATVKAAMASKDGAPGSGSANGQTWGDFLARDVKLIADDGITGIAFLPGWQKSKGAKLEAFVGVLGKLNFYSIEVAQRDDSFPDQENVHILVERSLGWVMREIAEQYRDDMDIYAPLSRTPSPFGVLGVRT